MPGIGHGQTLESVHLQLHATLQSLYGKNCIQDYQYVSTIAELNASTSELQVVKFSRVDLVIPEGAFALASHACRQRQRTNARAAVCEGRVGPGGRSETTPLAKPGYHCEHSTSEAAVYKAKFALSLAGLGQRREILMQKVTLLSDDIPVSY